MQNSATEVKSRTRRLVLLALVLAVFATTIIDVLSPLLLTEIADTFHVQVGTAGCIRSSSAIGGVIFGLLAAVLSNRYNHKTILIVGLSCEVIASIGGFLSPTLDFINAAFFLEGVGSVMVAAMAYSLIGDYYPPEKRTKPIGLIIAAGSSAFVITAPLIWIISDAGGWRSVLLLLILPVSAASLFFAFFAIPSKPAQTWSRNPKLFEGFRQVLSSRSAVVCLLGMMFLYASASVSTYLVSFWKIQFSIGNAIGATTMIVNSAVSVFSSAIFGRLVNRKGRKLLGVIGCVLFGIIIMLMFFMSVFLFSWGTSTSRLIFWALTVVAFNGLSLEQVPKFRGSMMSLIGAFSGIGSLLGISLGGMFLNLFDFQAMGVLLGSFGLVSAAIVFLLAKDRLDME